uniref:hypothetical protein n=1 Tax=Rhizobium laguerreae TaxID=1076926 RepID=UPI001C907B68
MLCQHFREAAVCVSWREVISAVDGLASRYPAAALKAERLDVLDRTPGEAAPVGRIVMLGDDMLSLCLAEKWYEHRKLKDRKAILGRPRLDGSCPGDLRAQVHRRSTQFSMMAGGDIVSGDVEEVG